MNVVLAFVIGTLYACGFYLMLRRKLVQVVIGLGLLTNAANLLIFTAAGLVRGNSPIVPRSLGQPVVLVADPLPQALVLTAIVIGFGVQAFSLVLVYRAFRNVGTDDVDTMRTTDR